ncbi:MAG: hypothetical protein FWC70_01580 [Defluviitaleaceae bacterium]|nr:hypothetical protein [Defluviitaleaceae bacterium]
MDKLQYHEKGLDYFYGRGVDKNYALAEENFLKAAEQGVSCSMFELYLLYDSGVPRNEEKAIYWLISAVKKKNTVAMFHFGTLHEDGDGAPLDRGYAAQLYNEAAMQGLDQAQINLGLMYEGGHGGLPQNFFAALQLYSRAARQGDTLALKNFWSLARKIGELSGEAEFRCGILARLATEKPKLAEALIKKYKEEFGVELTLFQAYKSPYPFYVNNIITTIVTTTEETLFPESAYKDRSYLDVHLFCATGTEGDEPVPAFCKINDNDVALVLYAENIQAICHATELLAVQIERVLSGTFNADLLQIFSVHSMIFAAQFLVLHEHMHHYLLHEFNDSSGKRVSVEKNITQELAADLFATESILTPILFSDDSDEEKELDILAFAMGAILAFITIPQPEQYAQGEADYPEHIQRIHCILVAIDDICRELMKKANFHFNENIFDIIGDFFRVLLHLPQQHFKKGGDSEITPSEIDMFQKNSVELATGILNNWESDSYNAELFRGYLQAIADDSTKAELEFEENLIKRNTERFRQISDAIVSKVITRMKSPQEK